MRYEVVTTKQIDKAIAAIPARDRGRVRTRLVELADGPRSGNAMKLTGSPAWRTRVGDWRIVYLIDDTVRVVEVTFVGNRRDSYRR